MGDRSFLTLGKLWEPTSNTQVRVISPPVGHCQRAALVWQGVQVLAFGIGKTERQACTEVVTVRERVGPTAFATKSFTPSMELIALQVGSKHLLRETVILIYLSISCTSG